MVINVLTLLVFRSYYLWRRRSINMILESTITCPHCGHSS